jgi:hypothetical protein
VVGRLRAWIKARNDATQARWDLALAVPRVRRTRFLAKVIAIHVRYACGYLMTGFLVSAPIQLGRVHEGGQAIFKSILLGLIFAVPFVALIPFTRIDWTKMRLPEFKNLELGLTKWSTIGGAAFLLFALLSRPFTAEGSPARWLLDAHIAWVTLGFMAFAWVRVQLDSWLFKEFYVLHPDDDTLVLFRLPPEERKAPAAETAAAPVEPRVAEPAPGPTEPSAAGAPPAGEADASP